MLSEDVLLLERESIISTLDLVNFIIEDSARYFGLLFGAAKTCLSNCILDTLERNYQILMMIKDLFF